MQVHLGRDAGYLQHDEGAEQARAGPLFLGAAVRRKRNTSIPACSPPVARWAISCEQRLGRGRGGLRSFLGCGSERAWAPSTPCAPAGLHIPFLALHWRAQLASGARWRGPDGGPHRCHPCCRLQDRTTWDWLLHPSNGAFQRHLHWKQGPEETPGLGCICGQAVPQAGSTPRGPILPVPSPRQPCAQARGITPSAAMASIDSPRARFRPRTTVHQPPIAALAAALLPGRWPAQGAGN